MTPFRRLWVTALGASLVALAFAFAILAMTPVFSKTLGAHNGSGLGVTYIFQHYDCVGSTTQYRSCRWLGTVTEEAGYDAEPNAKIILATNVVFRDEPPANVKPGDTIDALWTEDDRENAYDFYSSSAWLNTVASAVIAGIGTVLFLIIAIIWWRRVMQYRRDNASENEPKRGPDRASAGADRPES